MDFIFFDLIFFEGVMGFVFDWYFQFFGKSLFQGIIYSLLDSFKKV